MSDKNDYLSKEIMKKAYVWQIVIAENTHERMVVWRVYEIISIIIGIWKLWMPLGSILSFFDKVNKQK